MALLSTSSRLIKVGQDYSAGSGISIDNHTISVTGEFGRTYSAGDNIDIYEQDEQLYISSKDWTSDIANASANAYSQATAQIPEPFDPTYLSGEIDNKLNSTAFTTWQNGQYSTDLQTIEGQISNKLDTSSFSDVSGSFLTAHQSLDGYATENWVTAQGYLTGVSIPESATWQDVSETVQTNSAQWAEGGTGGDEEVNELVHSNSATWNEVSSKLDESTFQEASGLFLTAIPQEYITESDIPNFISAKLDTTAFADVSGSFLTAHQSLDGYATQDWVTGQGYLTAVNIPESATWNEVSTTVHTNSATWNEVTNKLDTTAFSDVSGNWVSGTNVVFKPDYAGSPGGKFYSAAISGDFVVTTGNYFNNDILPSKIYSLSSIGNNISNKLDKNIIEDSNTIKIIGGHAEVTDKAYRPTGFTTVSAYNIDFHSDDISILFSSPGNYDGLFSAKVIVETTNSGEVPDSWSLVSYENNSAIFTKYYSLNNTMDNFSLRWYKGWGTFTNCEASATVYSSVEMSTLAFKDEIPSTANFYTNDNPSGFITGVDLTQYQTIAGMTAYQPVGDYVQGSDLSLNSSNKISAISGYGLAGGAISSYTTAYSHDIPPYGDEVINSLNGKYLSAYVSQSADTAKVAKNANSATYAQTVDETKLENDGFVKNLSSDYGTISVVRNTIESTNSAISRVGNEGFVSSYSEQTIGESVTANFSWDKSLPNTTFNFTEVYASPNTPIYYSANTNLTGVVSPTSIGEIPFSIEVPNATAVDIWSNAWIQIKNNVASAADSFETVVGELAWASALNNYQPTLTFGYDEQDRISAINSSALAGGTDLEFGYTDADTISSINNSALTDASLNNIVQTNSGSWGGSALPISAGPGIKVNLVDNTLVFSNDETVLLENSNGVNEDTGFTISEPFTNFERIRYIGKTNNCNYSVEIPVYNGITAQFRFGATCMCPDNDGAPLQLYGKSFTSNNGLTYIGSRSEARWFDYTTQTSVNGTQPLWGAIYKVVGINRK